MFGWTLLDAIFGVDAETLIGVTDEDLSAGEEDDSEIEATPPDPVA